MLRLIALALLSAAARCRRLKQVGFRAALVPAVAWGGARPAVVAAIALTALGAAAAAQATTYPVSTTAQLEAAIAASNAGPGEDTINVAPGVYAPSGVLLITDDLTINGGGLPGAVIDGSGLHDVFHVFDVFSRSGAIRVIFNDLSIRNGNTGIDYRCGRLSLLSVNRSTFVGNGLGVWVEGGPAEITNSTLSGNTLGGIEYEASDPLTLTNDTIVDNTGSDGGFANFGSPSTVRNTIIAHNLRRDCIAPPDVGDHNLDSDRSCGPSATTSADPKLGPLADNGGPTQTHALLPGSPAIDAGSNTGCPPIDQRGVARPVRATCDIAAFEFIQPVVTFATSAGQLSNLSAVPEAILPTAGKPAGVTFPFGLFSWTVTGLTPGAIIGVLISHPSPVASPAQYWKVIGGTWTNATSLLGSDDGDNVLTLTIMDGGPEDADGAVNGQISDPGGVAIPVGPVVVPFAALTAKVEIERREFELKATFTLGAASNGIAPLTEDLTLQIGTFSTTIPAGSFEPRENGGFKFKGVINGVVLKASIRSLGGGSFKFKAEGKRANLGTPDPVIIAILIGDDGGSTTVRAESDREEEDDAPHD